MSDCTAEHLHHTPLFVRLFSMFLPSDPVRDSEAHLDLATRHAIRDLSPHMRRDIGLID